MGLIDYVRAVDASKKFKLLEGFDFIKFEDLTDVTLPDPPDELEMFAQVQLKWDGELPESNRVLNNLIADWVDENLDQLTKVIHARLKTHIAQHHPGSDHSALDQTEDTVVWTDQSEYMPDADDDKKTMNIEIELVLHAEPLEAGE